MADGAVPVQLHVYDLSQGLAKQLSAAFLGKTIEGIWHTGVVAYGTEYYFGGGIQRNPVGSSPYGTPLRVVQLGFTEVPQELLEAFLEEISPRYTPSTYKLLEHNCNNFSEEVSQFLVGSGIPEDILRLPHEVMSSPMGALIMPMIQNFETTLRNGGVPQVPHVMAPTNLGNRPTVPLSSASSVPRAGPAVVVPPNPSAKASPSSAGSKTTSSASAPAAAPAESTVVAQKEAPLQKPNADAAVSVATKAEEKDQNSSKAVLNDPLGDARAKVQEEITREFASIMAAGSVSASEAAALAARRVMERYGTRLNVQPSQRVS